MATPLEQLRLAGLRRAGWRSRRIPTSVGELHAFEVEGEGEGPPLVLLHGLAANGADYAPLVKRLRGHLRSMLLLDMPGHGMSAVPPGGLGPESMRQGLLEALDVLVDEPVLMFGNSLGGLAALRYAAERPGRVRGLFLASPGGGWMEPEQFEELKRSFRVDSLWDAVVFARRFLGRAKWVAPFLALALRGRLHRAPVRDLIDRMTTASLFTPKELAAVTAPAVLFWGQEDDLLPKTHRDWFHEHLPVARLVAPPGFGHAPYLDQPGEFARLLLDWVAEH